MDINFDFKDKVTDEYKNAQRDRRNNIYKKILKSNLDVNAHLIEFLEDPIDKIVFIEENNKCLNCTNADQCKAEIQHYQPTIQQHGEYYTLDYQLCNKQRGAYNDYMNIKECDKYYNTEARKEILEHFLKGVGGYIWGDGGHGKTFTLGYIANKLNKKGISIYFDLGAHIQTDLMNYDNPQKRLAMFKKLEEVDILLIDDFAGERWTESSILSCWVPLIKTRLDNHKPIYFSSNYSLESVGGMIRKITDETTANIIYDRIKKQKVFEFKDKNYRR